MSSVEMRVQRKGDEKACLWGVRTAAEWERLLVAKKVWMLVGQMAVSMVGSTEHTRADN